MVNLYLKAAGLGAVAGMRSMTAPALTSDHFAKQPSLFLGASPLKGLGLTTTASVLKLMALGELIVDKLPGVPNRTIPGSLVVRSLSGGICGAAVFLAEGKRAEVGAAVGAAAAIGSSFASFTLRRSLGQALKVPDPAVAVAEDTLALGLGASLLRST